MAAVSPKLQHYVQRDDAGRSVISRTDMQSFQETVYINSFCCHAACKIKMFNTIIPKLPFHYKNPSF
jgi:hypothetical protein